MHANPVSLQHQRSAAVDIEQTRESLSLMTQLLEDTVWVCVCMCAFVWGGGKGGGEPVAYD